ncbi:sulfite oxidase [Bacillus sp. T33-2]|uniref:sulfite oxidase n=1 Tax=Bacillus sp. T33-2 TaxID=2054168 RepID=UPI000C78F464|nr:sulfite oxidase [Bacillus sp. T33-2]PLR98839.1 sulfite oxidase [Bacillus sp. T33-2]
MGYNVTNIRPYLTTKSMAPENQESPVHFIPVKTTPVQLFFRRNHFPYPFFSEDYFNLQVSGAVETPLNLNYCQLTHSPAKKVDCLLECAGNKRSFFKEKVYGEQWDDGAIGEGTWKGVPLSYLIKLCGLKAGAKEVVFKGRDAGIKKNRLTHFERSLPISKALDPDVIVAWEFNGNPLTFKHGFPFRLIVPGWYAMASVKWLSEIHVIKDSFTGPFQDEDYMYYPDPASNKGSFPVTANHVNSIIQQPLHMQILNEGAHIIKGIAWTGKGVITKVEISFDKGRSWTHMPFSEKPRHNRTVAWHFPVYLAAGNEYHISIRAADSAGRVQPEQPFWNRKGYGYNAVAEIEVMVNT